MRALLARLRFFFKSLSHYEKDLLKFLIKFIGTTPNKLTYYKLAFQHSSKYKTPDNNERLEFLGDAIIGSSIAFFLYKDFPNGSEGLMSKYRSFLVSRNRLNNLAKEYGLATFVKASDGVLVNSKSILGDSLESLVAAIYLDQGAECATEFVLDKIFDTKTISTIDLNYKGKLIEWAQKQGQKIVYQTKQNTGKTELTFSSFVKIDKKIIGSAVADSKKSAEQLASKQACKKLHLS